MLDKKKLLKNNNLLIFVKIEEEKEEFDIYPHCQSCQSNCCYWGDVNILPHEYERIVSVTGLKTAFTKVKDYYIMEKIKGEPCKFLKEDGVSCSIQEIKPAECKAWPLYFDENGDIENSHISSGCPATPLLPDKYVGKLKKELSAIPPVLREEFFELTKQAGYSLEKKGR